MVTETLTNLKEKSIEVILDGQATSGAYIAAPTFKTYNYSWFRDGSFIADAMSRVGEVESAEAYFDWAAQVVTSREDRIRAGDILHTRYTAEGKESADEWPNNQLDGFGTLVWAMHEHSVRHERSRARWDAAIRLIAEYLAHRWQQPSHDWWEEYSAVHPATLASIYAALRIVDHPDADKVRGAIDLENARLDASLVACATPFCAVRAQDFAPTLLLIEEKLMTPGGGLYRHQSDVYYGGGEWPLLTCFLGWHYAEIGRTADAHAKLERVMTLMDENGWLPEQTSEYMLAADYHDEWVAKWGPAARPLLWSHAMFLTLASVLKL
jgi:GH15 family glucan-1,4-alpha-glucosidase